jgi:uncharacterized membrane protein
VLGLTRPDGIRKLLCLSPQTDMSEAQSPSHPGLRTAALVFVFLWFFIGGIAHFAATQTEMRIVPPYIPAPRATVLISGVFELLGAMGVLLPRLRAAAGAGLLLLTLAVTPANVYMLQHWDLFPVPYWALVARLPLQLVLLWAIAWSTHVQSLFRGGATSARP